MNPINVEVVIPTLTALSFDCKACSLVTHQLKVHGEYIQDCNDDYPEEWKEENAKLFDCIKYLKEIYKHRIHFRIIDAQSPVGLWKQIIHRPSKLPAFIINKKDICVGWEMDQLELLIDERIKEDLNFAK
jgi:hypothetical protein